MKDVVTIKLYKNEMDTDYHDMMLECYPQLFADLQSYFSAKNTHLCIAYLHACMAVLDSTPFAEVEYTGELTKQDKDVCIDALMKLSGDWEYRSGGMCEFSQLQLIKFAKISRDDVYLVKKTKLNLCENVLEHIKD